MRIVPITVKAAARFNAEHHRHLPKIQGGLFACAIADSDGRILGVSIAANPARVWQGTGRIVIARNPTDGSKNACSMLLGAICRAAAALGYVEAWTYTLPHEPGTSLRAAGFEYMGMTAENASFDRPSRRRNAPVKNGAKLRWRRVLAVAPPGRIEVGPKEAQQ